MKTTSQITIFFLAWLLCFEYCYGQGLRDNKKGLSALENYLDKKDNSFSRENYHTTKSGDGTFYEVSFSSQTWQSIIWKHRLILYFPKKSALSSTMLVVLQHGHYYDRDAGMAGLKTTGDSTGTPAAILYDIPNQPLFDGKEEDDLQAFTFSQYLKSGDESWPLLFPMVKSVVRAMDVAQSLAKMERKVAVTGFVISGHSKRGHTTWLSAATDSRIKGIIPIAIDILNSRAQMSHHLKTFGQYNTPSESTTELVQKLEQPRGQSLIEMVDAYSYRNRFTMPKLIVSATNDQFFATDALNLYWDGLKKPKWVLYLSNANHFMAYSDPRIIPTAFAFARAIAAGKSLPELNWEFSRKENVMVLKIIANPSATQARVWTSQSKNKDFRQAIWKSAPMNFKGRGGSFNQAGDALKEFTVEVALPTDDYTAIFGEIEFELNGRTFLLSTQTKISNLKE